MIKIAYSKSNAKKYIHFGPGNIDAPVASKNSDELERFIRTSTTKREASADL